MQWYLTTYVATWTNVFREQFRRPQIAEDYADLLAVDLAFVIIAKVKFHLRDFKS